MTTILFTGGGGAGNEAIWRLLGDRYLLHFGDADMLAIDPTIPEARRHALPWAHDARFVPMMAEICRRLEVDLLVPGVDEELTPLADAAHALEPTRLLLPSTGYVRTMTDKLSMARALESARIPVPASCTLTDDFAKIEFPCIAKPRRGRGSRDVRTLGSVEEADSLRRARGSIAHETMLQQLVRGVEYTVQMVADSRGTLCAVVPVRVDIKRGITIRATTDAEPRVTAACQAIHAAFPTPGCYNIQLMLTGDGVALPFEINPRISTTFCLVLAAEIDPIAEFLGPASDGSSLRPFTAGVRIARHWKNHFLELGPADALSQ